VEKDPRGPEEGGGSLFGAELLRGYIGKKGLGRFSPRDLLSRILTTIPGIVYVYSMEGNHTLFVSRGILSILGYPPEEVSRDPGFFLRITHPEDSGDIAEWHSRLRGLEDGAVIEHSYRMRHRSGHYVYLRCRETVFAREASGRPLLIIGSATDETEAVVAERELLERTEELRRSEARYRLLVETSVDAIVGVDPDMRIVLWNPAAERMFGYTAGEMLGESLLRIVPESQRESKRRGFSVFSTTGEGEVLGGIRELEGLHRDGSLVPLEISIAPLEVDGRWTATGILRDISERRRAQRRQRKMAMEMQRIQRLDAVGALAGGIAHDFNNMLSSVLGNISMARETARGNVRLEELLQQSEEAVLQARELAGQLLTFAEGGEPVREVLDIGPMVEKGCRFSLSGSGSRCRMELEPGLYVRADGGQISQMSGNLALNASQAMEGSGEVVVRAFRTELGDNQLPGLPEGSYVAVEVEDTGPGIPEDCAEKIFNPFFTTRSEGHGLGLSVCYSIARQHGGTVVVESEPGEGALFRILLPFSDRPAPESARPPEDAVPAGCRILVMDDDDEVRKVLRQMLESLGMEVEEAPEGRGAIELYRTALRSGEAFDLLIMDLTVAGGMGGAEAMRELVRMDPEVTAVVSSGYSNAPVMARYEEHGFAGVLKKPFTLAELRKALVGTLGGEAGI
jgi:PAS domain S-box-containing protein